MMYRHQPFPSLRAWLFGALILLVSPMEASTSAIGMGSQTGSGFIQSIVNAPVVPDGLVAGRPTDFVINLDTSLDPGVPGRTLPAGGTIKVTLPDAFTRDPAVPFHTFLGDPSCRPPIIACNTVVLLQGWPQHPVGFPPPRMPELWTVGFDETGNTVIVTALRDLPADPPTEP